MKSWLPLILLMVFCATQAQAFAAPRATIDPRVIADLAAGNHAQFLVVLRNQVNTRARVANIVDRNARGGAVFDSLRATANASQPALRAQLAALGVPYRAYWIVNVIAAEGDRAVVDAIANRADVFAIESNRAFQVDLPKPETSLETLRAPRTVEWNVSKVNAPALWANGFTGQGIIYANADTGVQWTHPALQPHYAGWNGVSANHNYAWWDAIHTDISGGGNPCGFSTLAPCDDLGHGTHTTGIGVGDDSAGNQIGVAPGAKWIGCRNMEQGWGQPSTYIECFQFFLAPTDLTGANPDPSRRPHVVGNSYGCPPVEGCSANSLLTAMDNLRAAGIFMAVSAGNSGPSCSTINDPPAIYDSAITVGSTDVNDVIAGNSSRGPVTVDGSNRRKPDLVAPGVSVRSSYPANLYVNLSGTSMASPHVAGAVALLWSAYPCLRRNVDATEMILQQTALPLTTAQGCGGDSSSSVPNNVYGFGRIDTRAAFNYTPALAEAYCQYSFPNIFNTP